MIQIYLTTKKIPTTHAANGYIRGTRSTRYKTKWWHQT